MIDWTKSMEQTFDFYTVDPNTWKDDEVIETIVKDSCVIDRDLTNSTLGSATLDSTEVLDECYIRIYLVVIQNGETGKFPLGTFLVQTPGTSFDGKIHTYSMDAYTPLIELKSDNPPIGYTVPKGENIMNVATVLCRENMRAPIVPATCDDTLYSNFIANLDDTWHTFISDLIYNAKYEFALDEMGRVLFQPIQDFASLQAVCTYNDDNSSILHPAIKDSRDLYDIPNVVEVIYSTGTGYLFSRVVNDDPNSPISTVNRGRELLYRETNPSVQGEPTQEYLDAYAKQLLRNKSCLEHTLTYTHGYSSARVGDCVMLNYKRSGITYTKAKVISQSIKCKTGCPVEETAVYTQRLWG